MKTLLITGIGKGIGHALAEEGLRRGHAVIGTYLTQKPTFAHPNLTMLPLDLSSPQSIKRCTDKLCASRKKIDILINNAGILGDENETSVIVQKLRKTLEVNLIGTIDFTERMLPAIKKDGQVINISSSAGSLAWVDKEKSHFPLHYPAYKISKAALNMYTRTLALRLAATGPAVSSVHPGWVRTGMGGSDADLSPSQAAARIFDFAKKRPATGGFWFGKKQIPW